MKFKFKDLLIDFRRANLTRVAIFLNFIYLIYIYIRLIDLIFTLHAEANAITILINVLKDIFVDLNVSVNFYVNISIILSR